MSIQDNSETPRTESWRILLDDNTKENSQETHSLLGSQKQIVIPPSIRSFSTAFNEIDPVLQSYLQFKPLQRFYWDFPPTLEELLRPFDDRLISICQFSINKFLILLCKAITLCVAIEIIFALPFVLFCLGVDGLASEMSYLALVTAIFSQLPKRFIWRYRPWMVLRSNQLATPHTSSFPSRAVCCSLVYSFAVCYGYLYFTNSNDIIWWWMPEIIFIFLFLASFARVFLGVHYPSDCLVGAVQGIVISLAGTFLWGADLLGCQSCREGGCYSDLDSSQQLTGSNLLSMSIWPFLGVVFVSVLFTIIVIVKPVEFWRKCDRALGMILPCIAFQVGFLCPNGSLDDSSLSAPLQPPPWWTYPFAFIIPIFYMAVAQYVSHKLKARFPLLMFLVIYFSILAFLVVWRLFIFPFTG